MTDTAKAGTKRARSRMTRREAGRLDGNTTKQRYADKGFFSNIGEIGGKARGKRRVIDKIKDALPLAS